MSNALNEAGVYSTTKKRNDMDAIKLQANQAHEDLQAKRISNQTKLGILILKSEAYIRVLKFLYAFQNLLKNTIKLTASNMIGKDFSNKRNNEIFLTSEYNNCVNFLRENAKIFSWAEDGSHYVTKTRLTALSKIDEDIEKEISDLNVLEEDLQELNYENNLGDKYE
jgi:hypothetical protein